MKGTFTLLLALVLSVAVNAQARLGEIKPAQDVANIGSDVHIITPSAKKNNAPMRKIEIGEGERIMGYYIGDELYDALCFETSGTYMVANDFNEEVLSDFVGGQIMRFRFGLGCDTKVYDVRIYTADSDGYLELIEYISFGENGAGETLEAGWVDVELPEPITIDGDYEYLIGYTYEQIDADLTTGAGYSICVDYLLEQDVKCNYFYYSVDGYYWYGASGWGALSIQAVVKGGQFADYDISLKGLSVDKYASKGKEISYSYQIKSNGNYYPESYTLKVAIDDDELETLSNPIEVTGKYQTISGSIATDNLSVGTHKLSISVVDINGAVPTERTSDDELSGSFQVYEGEMAERHKYLVEEFTSIYCQYCQRGVNVLEALQENNPDKYACVALHSIGMNSGSNVDTLALYQNNYLAVEYFLGVSAYPMASFSRAPLTNADLGLASDYVADLGYSSQYTQRAANDFNEAVDEAFEDVPAFATVEISPTYNSDTRELTIIVSGSGSESAKDLLEGSRLTIYLTEDGIAGRQYTYNETTGRANYENVTHNHVLRAIPTTYEWGDDIIWTSSSTYENTVKTVLPAKWDDSQIYITAFISGSMAYQQGNYWYYNDISDGVVNNTNCVKAIDVSAGISAVTVNTDDVTHTYYTTDGRQLSAPVKGVNIVKSSDGTVKKIYVK